MIDLYYWPTPNGWKIAIMLEECELPYRLIPVNLGKGEQFAPEFLAISPNNRMPAIVDHDADADFGGEPVAVFESGAILLYLAEKTGRFLPTDARARLKALEWLFWQVGGLGPMAGQLSHFVNYAEGEHTYSHDRYSNEYNRLLGVMDRALAKTEFLAGDYSIADMASWPWVISYKHFGQDMADFPNLKRWHEAMKARPAARRGVDAGKELRTFGKKITPEARKIMFGQTARAVADQAATRETEPSA